MNREDNTAVESANNEFLMTRIFDAPRELVFNAWTERERLMQWWGPEGFTMHRCNIDLPSGRRLSLRHAGAGRLRDLG